MLTGKKWINSLSDRGPTAHMPDRRHNSGPAVKNAREKKSLSSHHRLLPQREDEGGHLVTRVVSDQMKAQCMFWIRHDALARFQDMRLCLFQKILMDLVALRLLSATLSEYESETAFTMFAGELNSTFSELLHCKHRIVDCLSAYCTTCCCLKWRITTNHKQKCCWSMNEDHDMFWFKRPSFYFKQLCRSHFDITR